ncbi:MAG: hypothetical protein K2N89_07200, partial [Lachnospiraceae bacterium]|nr:hypothetical protein [Lachnospiraceae bacterium]
MNKKKSKKKSNVNINETKKQTPQNVKAVSAPKDTVEEDTAVKENTVLKEDTAAKENSVKEEKKGSGNAQTATPKKEPQIALRKPPVKGGKNTNASLASLLKDTKISSDLAVSGLKILLPVAACVLVIAVIISVFASKGKGNADSPNANLA